MATDHLQADEPYEGTSLETVQDLFEGVAAELPGLTKREQHRARLALKHALDTEWPKLSEQERRIALMDYVKTFEGGRR